MNQFNPMKLLQIKASWEQFKARHPKFPSFLNAVSKGAVMEGTLQDMKLINDMQEMFMAQQGN